MEERVVLVDKNDKELGTEEKLKAHKEGLLHRSFSIFVFNSKGELLLQQREPSKYHWGGYWSNTCCSHPRQGEALEKATQRKLQQEMGFGCELKELFTFIYKVQDGTNLWEHELDHVFVGTWDGIPKPNINEVGNWKWEKPEELKKDLQKNPEKYTPWFRIALERVIAHKEKGSRV